jgi:methylmalonyl-CoA mutase N-terminal domain/subunit
VQKEIQDAAYNYQRSIETLDRVVVGVNKFRSAEEQAIPIHTVDPALELAQIENLGRVRSERDGKAVEKALANLRDAAAATEENLLPRIVAAVEAYASVGEISDVFRAVHGEFQEASTF